MSLYNVEFRIILTGNQTSNLTTITEDLLYRGEGSRCQIHRREDMVYRVLNGTLQFYVGGHQFCASAGTVVYIPRNVTQSQRNLGTQAVLTELILTPSGIEGYLYELILLIRQQQPLNRTQIAGIAEKYGTTLCEEIDWEDLGCAFNNCTFFTLSFHLTCFVFLLYISPF